jgi:cell wall-active antibiotic response 4TMS protein YvqF
LTQSSRAAAVVSEGIVSMSDKIRCQCERCRVRRLMGPVVLIVLGVLFLLDQTVPELSFGRLWPVILLAIGGVKLAESLASTEGHAGSQN